MKYNHVLVLSEIQAEVQKQRGMSERDDIDHEERDNQ